VEGPGKLLGAYIASFVSLRFSLVSLFRNWRLCFNTTIPFISTLGPLRESYTLAPIPYLRLTPEYIAKTDGKHAILGGSHSRLPGGGVPLNGLQMCHQSFWGFMPAVGMRR
jgi:hypothetical protein